MHTIEGHKVAIVTGAASGIGKSVTELFKKNEYDVFEIDIQFERKHSSASDFRIGADLTSPIEVKKVFDLFQERSARLDVVVNSAGIEMSGNVVDLPVESFERVMNTNVKSVFLVCKYSIPMILKTSKRGSIVNISSDLGIQPIPNSDAYAASKGAVISLTKALSKNWAKQGLRVNCIAPGPIETPLLYRFQSTEMLDLVKNVLIPAGRLGTPEEVANVAFFLASEKSSFINGAILTVNGGLLG